MDRFKLLLAQFDNTLKQFNLSNYEKLYSPLSNKEVVYQLQQLGVNNENLTSLFNWKNGYDPAKDAENLCQIFDIGTLLSIEFIIEIQKMWAGIYWTNYFIPLITDSTGQYILYNNKRGLNYGKLYLYSTSMFGDELVGYYDSIYAMINTTVEAYEQNIFTYDPVRDWLDIDYNKYHSVAKKINNNSKFWKL
jgi:hypothetical protein